MSEIHDPLADRVQPNINKEAEVFQSVWNTLSNYDIKPYIQEKMGLSYLSWANAHAIIQEHYPGSYEEVQIYQQAQIEDVSSRLEVCYYPGGTAEVGVTLHIFADGYTISRTETLAVMGGGQNKAIVNPSTRDINDTKKRCFVKCAALFGLGLRLWTQDALPRKEEESVQEAKPKQERKTAKKKTKSKANGISNPVSSVFDALILDDIKDIEELTAIWKSHKDALELIKKESPEDYQATVELFRKRKKSLEHGG